MIFLSHQVAGIIGAYHHTKLINVSGLKLDNKRYLTISSFITSKMLSIEEHQFNIVAFVDHHQHYKEEEDCPQTPCKFDFVY
jgi:hypothetical protein